MDEHDPEIAQPEPETARPPTAEKHEAAPAPTQVDAIDLLRQRLGGFRPLRALALSVIVLAILAGIGAFRPSGYLSVAPGPDPLISGHVSGATDPTFGHGGRWYFTTIELQPVTWGTWVWAHLFGSGQRFEVATALPGVTSAEADAAAQAEMAQAKQTAAAVAVDEVSGAHARGDGAEVLEVPSTAAAAATLQPGDIITAVGATPVTGAQSLIAALRERAPGIVQLTVRRARHVVVIHSLIDSSHQLGVEVLTHLDNAPRLGLNTEGIGGPSGGLMFALAFADAITPGDLTGGHAIAGTGTLSPSGAVGPISGIREKVAGAARHGVQVFFAPATEAALAREAAPRSMTVVPVRSYTAALRWLCDHGGRSSVCGRVR